MNLRQVAQQALEAMDKATRFMSDSDYKKLNQAIDDLRAALAEPEQEPVAWMDIDDNGQRLTVRQWSDGNSDEVPLYTAPTPRRSLTDEELRDCFTRTNTAEPLAEGWPGLERFARAIERAHGIGEQHD